MNRRLLRAAYRYDDLTALFHAGLPTGWDDTTVTGTSSGTTVGYDDADGPAWVGSPRGTTVGNYVWLKGPELNLSVVKAVEVEFQNVTLDGDVQCMFGLWNAAETHFARFFGYAHNASSNHGFHRLITQNGSSGARTSTDILGAAATAATTNLTYGLEIDVTEEIVDAHVEFSYARNTTNFPTGQTLVLGVKPLLLASGATPTVRVGRINLIVYT